MGYKGGRREEEKKIWTRKLDQSNFALCWIRLPIYQNKQPSCILIYDRTLGYHKLSMIPKKKIVKPGYKRILLIQKAITNVWILILPIQEKISIYLIFFLTPFCEYFQILTEDLIIHFDRRGNKWKWNEWI